MAMFLTDGAAEFDEIYKYKSLGELTGYSIGYQAGTEGNPKPSLLVQSSSQSTYYVQAYNESVKNGYLDGSKESQGGSSQSTDSSVAMIVGLLVLGIVIFVFFRDRAKK
jgi:hypothetical protein